MSSLQEFKNNRRIDMLKRIIKPIGDNLYFVWILVPIFFFYMSLSNDAVSTECDKVTSHKTDNRYKYLYVQNEDEEFVEIGVDSTEYANFMAEYNLKIETKSDTDIVYCYEKNIPTFWIYPISILISIIIFLVWSSFRYKWSSGSSYRHY